MTLFPPAVQNAIDYGRTLPSVDVCFSDWRGLPSSPYIEVDFIIGIPDDSIELGTVWCPRPDGWTLTYAGWRTFSRQDDDLVELDTWDDVRAFLASQTTGAIATADGAPAVEAR
ncbi:hypothetical protein ACWEPC_01915 [Nonomuraea sp. NPDC004297]